MRGPTPDQALNRDVRRAEYQPAEKRLHGVSIPFCLTFSSLLTDHFTKDNMLLLCNNSIHYAVVRFLFEMCYLPTQLEEVLGVSV